MSELEAPKGDNSDAAIETEAEIDLARFLHDRRYAKYKRFIFAALGSLPWIGAIIAASTAIHAENEQSKVNDLHRRWMEEHEDKLRDLGATLAAMMNRLEQLGPVAAERIQEEPYLGLVRQGFRVWDEASTKTKRERVRQTLTNAAASRIASDDVVRLFLQWLRIYDDLHLRVVSVIYQHPGATRGFIWDQIHAEEVREDSAEADLFKLMIHDLSTGRVIRQERETTPDGRFLRKPAAKRSPRRSTLESAFEDGKPYELTQLGSQFVHYAMTEVSRRIGSGGSSAD